jgi:signal peptidase I
MREGRLYINDKLVPRRQVGAYEGNTLYVESLPAPGGGTRDHEILEVSDTQAHDETPVFVVPDRHYFMMGDNRDDSLDSRIAAADGGVGFVPEENLVARADRLLLSRDTKVGWGDVGEWSHAFRLTRFFGRID